MSKDDRQFTGILSTQSFVCYTRIMIKTIDIMGIRLNNNYTRDQILETEKYFQSPLMQTVELISTEMILQAIEDPRLRETVDGLDLPIMGDADLYDVLALTSQTRRKEAGEHRFVREFFKRMEQHRRSLFILADDRIVLDDFSERLRTDFPKLLIIEGDVIEGASATRMDEVINRINGETPDVVCSLLSSPLQEEVLHEHRQKINARMWLGLGQITYGQRGRIGLKAIVRHQMAKVGLKKQLAEYQKTIY